MRKEVMLSLVAMTSVPIATLANADLTNTVNGVVDKMESGDSLSIEDGVFVSTGSPVVIEIGKLVKGCYRLTATTKGDNVKLTVNGKELSDGKFSLSGETTVTIKAESTDSAEFQVGGFKLELLYDFKSAYTVLNTKLSGAYKKLNAEDPDFWELELLKRYNDDLAARIEAVKDDSEDSYKVYEAEGLYEEKIDDSKIAKDVNAFVLEVANALANKENKTYAYGEICNLRDSLLSIEDVLEPLSDDAKALFKEEVESLSDSIVVFETAVKTYYEAKEAFSRYGKEVVDAKVKEIGDEIAKTKRYVEVNGPNYDANEAVETLIADLRQKLTGAKGEAAKCVSEDEMFNGATAWNKTVETLQEKINEYTKDAGEAYKAKTSVKYKEDNVAAFAATARKIDAYKSEVSAAFGKYNAVVKAVAGNNEALGAVKAFVGSDGAVTDTTGVSYSNKIAGIQTRIDNLQKALDEAMKQSDGKLANALDSINVDGDIDGDIAAMTEEQFKTDKERYVGTINVDAAKQQLVYQQNRKTEIGKSLAGFSDTYTQDALGKGFDAVNEKLQKIEDDFANVEMPTISAEEITVDNAGTIRLALVEVNNALNEISTRINDLKTEAEKVKQDVDANKTQKAAADKRVEALGTKAGNIKVKNEDASRNGEFEGLYNEVIEAIDVQTAAIVKSFEAETLVADWGGISAALGEIDTKINDYIDKATASTENHTAYQDQTGICNVDSISTLVANAQEEVKKLVPEGKKISDFAGLNYYYNTVLGENSDNKKTGYYQKAQLLRDSVESWYRQEVSVGKTEGVKMKVGELIIAISAVVQKAEANEIAHNCQVEAKDSAQAKLNSVRDSLEKNDKSTQREKWLADLDTIQVKINNLNRIVEDAYANGECEDKDFAVDYTEWRMVVQTVEEQWKGNYNDAVIADNKNRYDRFNEAIAAAKDEYDKDVLSIAKFSSVRDEYFKNKITEIVNANDSLYTYPEQIRKLTGKANAEYSKSNSEDLYDAEEDNITKANQLKSGIERIYKDFTNKANLVANSLYAEKIANAETQLDNALETLGNYKTEVKERAFADISTIIAESRYKANDNPELVLVLDGILNELAKIENLVPAGQEAAAVAEYNAVMSELDKNIAANLEELEKFVLAESNTTDYLAEYNKALSAYIDGKEGAKAVGEAAIAEKNLFGGNLEAVKTLIDKFKENNKYDKAKESAESNEESLESWKKMNERLAELQAALDTAKVYADDYYVDKPQIVGCQSKIDDKRNEAEEYKFVGAANENETTFLAQCDSIAKEIDGLNAIADLNEYTGLINAINELKAEYNNAVAVGGSEELAKYEDAIMGYREDLEKINGGNFEGDRHASFIALEKKIAVTHSELANVHNDQLATDTYNSLIASINAIKEKQASEVTDLEKCNDVVKKAYADALAGILVKAEAAKDGVDASNEENTLLFYNNNRIKEIDAIAVELDNIAENIDKTQAPYTANDNAYARLNTELDKLQTAYNTLAEKLDGYGCVEFEEFEEAAKTNIVDKIAEDRKAVEKKHSATEIGEMLKESSQLNNKQDVEKSLSSLDKKYSHVETDGRVSAVEANKDEVKNFVANGRFTAEAKGSLQEQINDIEKSLDFLKTYNTDAYVGIILKDINGKPLVEDGNEMPFQNIDFVKEAVPAIFEKVEELGGSIDRLQTEAEENCYIFGDITRDGGVFADDYTMICNVVLEKASFEEGSVKFLAADINEDGKVNVGDVSAVARIIRGMDNATSGSHARSFRAPSAVATVDDVISLSAAGEGTRQRIAINLQNAKAYNACQMDIKLPSGLRIAGERLGERAEGMTLMSNELSNGAYRIMLSTLDEVEIAEGTGAIVYLDVEVGYSYSGEGIEVSDVLFADSKAHLYQMGGIGANDVTGIGTVTLGEAVKGKIYSVGGVLMNGLKRGVNIIRGNDGSTKKVIVK